MAGRGNTSTQGRSGSGRGGGALYDTNSLEGLSNLAKSRGVYDQVENIVDPKQKLSFLQRLSAGLSSFNPAEAILVGREKGLGQAALEYGKDIAKGLGSAITGKPLIENRRYFSDVAEELGIENKILKGGLGFVGDVLLDPSTYFGGAIARGLVSGTSKVGAKTLTSIGKYAPETEAGLRLAKEGISDALGGAFKFGYKSTKGASDKVLTFLSDQQKARLGLAASNLNRLGTGTLSVAQQEELALKLVAGKRAEFLAREAGKTTEEAGKVALAATVEGVTDPKVLKTIEEQVRRTAKFGDQLGLENPYEVYFPFIKNTSVSKFLNESKGIKVGSEGYLKQFKNLLTNENMEMNPAKAFFTREEQIVSDKLTRNFLSNFVDEVGKPLDAFASNDDALRAGYQVIREKGVFGKELGYLNKWDAKLIKDAISPEFQTINMLAKATGFDAVTSLFKRSVTGLFAPFHARNYVSGIVQNYEVLGLDALNPKLINAGRKIAYKMARNENLSGTIELAGKKASFKSIMKPFTRRFSGDTFYNADWDMAVKNGALKQSANLFSKETLKETAKTAGLGVNGVPFRVARATGQFIEHQQKAVAYLGALNQGKSITEALKLAENAGFDYRALTRFESQIMRRIVPFYSFTRKNIGLQLSTLGENPQRINQVLAFFQNLPIGERISQEDRRSLPKYISESLGLKLSDTPEGLSQYISSFGTPIEAFAQLFGSNPILRGISQMNPLLKAPIEIGTGKESFRQKDLKEVYDAREYKMAPQVLKDLLDIQEVEKDILTKLPSGKLIKTGTRTEYQADPVRLLVARSLFTSRGVTYLDQLFGGDLEGFAKVLKTTTGLKPQQFDLEQQASIQERKAIREAQDELTKLGITSQFSRTYIPK